MKGRAAARHRPSPWAAFAALTCTFWAGAIAQPQAPAPAQAPEAPAAQCSDTTCSGHGRCHDGWCECYSQWAGAVCDYFVEDGTAASLPATAVAGAAPVPGPGPFPAAVSVPSPASFYENPPDGCSDWCSGHGQCEAGLCHCNSGWTGSSCTAQVQCSDNCNSPSGQCVQGVCVCQMAFAGPTCADRACAKGPTGEDCWGHGTCVNGGCACLDGWSGEACDVRQSVMPTLTADSPAQPALALAPAPAMAQSPAPTQQAALSPAAPQQAAPSPAPTLQTAAPAALLATGAQPAAPQQAALSQPPQPPLPRAVSPTSVPAPQKPSASLMDKVFAAGASLMQEAVELVGGEKATKATKASDQGGAPSVDTSGDWWGGAKQQEQQQKPKATALLRASASVNEPAVPAKPAAAPVKPLAAAAARTETLAADAASMAAKLMATADAVVKLPLAAAASHTAASDASSDAASPEVAQVAEKKIRAAMDAAQRALSSAAALQKPEGEASSETAAKPMALAAVKATAAAADATVNHAASAADAADPLEPADHPCIGKDHMTPCKEEKFLVPRATTTPPPEITTTRTCVGTCTTLRPATEETEDKKVHLKADPSEPQEGDITFSMKVVNCDYHKLTRDAVLLNDFEETIRQVIADSSGSTITTKDVGLVIAPGSVIVRVTVTPQTKSMAKDVMDKLKGMPLQQLLDSAVTKIPALEAMALGNVGVTEMTTLSITPKSGELVNGMPAIPWGSCTEGCSGHGDCDAGVCSCTEGWSGDVCDVVPCPGYCEGRGTCMMGTCVCNVNFYGAECQYERCPNDCSGNGFCDKGTCACNVGFQGSGCHIRAPKVVSASEKKVEPQHLQEKLDILKTMMPPVCPENCNGRGSCGSSGSCACIAGFSGIACQNYCPNLCSGHGECTTGMCVCMSGFSGADCSLKTCCSGHGDCSLPDACVCDPGFMGDMCELEMSCIDPTCSGHGSCGLGSCKCEAGWGGPLCREWPKECGAPCPDGGACDRASGTCMCGMAPCLGAKVGGMGLLTTKAAVNTTLAAAPRKLQLLRTEQTGEQFREVAAPRCNFPYGKWDDTVGACACTGKWYGAQCEVSHCPDWSEASPVDCSGHGACGDGQCLCNAGWGLGPGKAYPNLCADEVCPADCGEHGMCKNNVCVCQDGWQGPACRQPKCGDHGCSGHGMCTFVTPDSPAECACEYGYAMPTCGVKAFYATSTECPNSCSGNGLCMDGTCVCGENFLGADCSDTKCPDGTMGPGCQMPSCPRECDGHGICMGGMCLCDKGHGGQDCSIPVVCLDSCFQVCNEVGLESPTCETCKGQCLTLQMSPVLGRHDPLQERFSTLDVGHRARNHTMPGQSLRLLQTGVSAGRARHHRRARHHEVSAIAVKIKRHHKHKHHQKNKRHHHKGQHHQHRQQPPVDEFRQL